MNKQNIFIGILVISVLGLITFYTLQARQERSVVENEGVRTTEQLKYEGEQPPFWKAEKGFDKG